jgi:hypothetical protein
MNPDAPLTGGFSPGGNQFAVDGDFSQFDPCWPPKISFPMKGDSVFSKNDILILGASDYAPIAVGTFPNLQPWSSNQRAMMIEQDFMVALEYYQPMPLNTPYNDAWGIGWQGQLTNGQPTEDLSDCVLVEIGETEDMGQGIVKVKLRFANVPPTRNEMESFTYTFPGLDNGRNSFTQTVQSRLQYDYFVFDDFDILSTPLFPEGTRLSGSTGLYPPNLILPAQRYYTAAVFAISFNNFLDISQAELTNVDEEGNPGTIPSADDWIGWITNTQDGDSKPPKTSNGLPPEIIAESSTMRRWFGNIWERRTRFVLLQ